MKKLSLGSCLLAANLVAAIFAPPLVAQALWQNTSYGMTKAEIAKQYPNVRQDKDRPDSEKLTILTLEDVSIADNKFLPMLTLEGGKLTTVTLRLTGEPSYTEASQVRDTVTTILRSKYGQELSVNEGNGSFGKDTVTWKSNLTTIELSVMYIPRRPAILSIKYSAVLAQEAGKL